MNGLTIFLIFAWLLLVRSVVVYAIRWDQPKAAWAPEPRLALQWAEMRFKSYKFYRDGFAGWAVVAQQLRVLGFLAEPYDDLMPVVPFLVTRWSLSLIIFGRGRVRWNRRTTLSRYKQQMPIRLAPRSAWTMRPDLSYAGQPA